jgi:hypothetical protein
MLGTAQKKLIAVILTLAMLVSFMPLLTLTARAEHDEIQADASDTVGLEPETEQVLNEPTEDGTDDNGSDTGKLGSEEETAPVSDGQVEEEPEGNSPDDSNSGPGAEIHTEANSFSTVSLPV